MNPEEFNYDVAFSFTQQDEELAFKFYQLLRNRLSCFLYSEEQKKLSGGDGETLFNSVFSKESRIVVILYRADYGKTKWTRIEETAIRNRGYEEGYDFVLLIPLEKEVLPPAWLPKNRLWIGLERWGLESAASIIEARVQEYGGIIKQETIADSIAKKEYELQERKRREQVLDSDEGLGIATKEVRNIIAFVSEHIAEIEKKAPKWQISYNPNNQNCINVRSYGHHLTFQWHQQYGNILHGSQLYVGLHEGNYDENGYSLNPFHEKMVVESVRLKFDIDDKNQNGWSLFGSGKKFLTTEKLVDSWMEKLIECADKTRIGKR
jgi:hypothetical protein